MKLALLALLMAGPRFGLFVGSNGAPVGREPLKHAEADASRMRDVFVDLGEMKHADTELLQSPDRRGLLAALEALAEKAKADPDSTVVFYYSGHADDRALLLGSSEVRHAELRDELADLGARMGIHIVDACRAGALTRLKGARAGARFDVDVAPRHEGRVVIASTAEFEDAQESDRLGGSFFTLHLISGLRGAADGNEDGRVTVAEAYDYVYARTVESTRATAAGPQHPAYRYDLEGRGETVLTWLETDDLAELVLGAGDYMVVDAATDRVAAEVLARGQTLALRPGRYRVSRREPDSLWQGSIELRAGDRLAVDEHLEETAMHASLAKGGGARHALWVESGVRGPLGEGISVAPLVRLAYALSLPWLTLRPRVGISLGVQPQRTERIEYDVDTLAAGLELRRDIELSWSTLSAGVVGEALWLRQIDRADEEPNRTAFGFVVGGLVALEPPPIGPLRLAIAAELDAFNFPATDADRAPADEGDLRTVLSFRTTLGLGYAF